MHELLVGGSISPEPIYADVSLWERVIVYDSPDDVIKPLTEDEQKGQAIRLVEAANKQELQRKWNPSANSANLRPR